MSLVASLPSGFEECFVCDIVCEWSRTALWDRSPVASKSVSFAVSSARGRTLPSGAASGCFWGDVTANDCERLLAEVHEMRRSTPSVGQLRFLLERFPPRYGEYLGIPMDDMQLSAIDIMVYRDRIAESSGAVVTVG